MKTRVLSALGALAMGALAAGCSAETGASGEGIGVTTAALCTLANVEIAAGSLATLNGSASCTINDGAGTDWAVYFGGSSNSGTTVVKTVYLYNPTTNKWYQGPDMTTARYKAKAINLPGTDQCIVAGGKTSAGADIGSSQIFDLSVFLAGTGCASGWDTEDTTLIARSDFDLVRCGTSGVMAVGGLGSGAIESWDGADWNTLVTLSTARSQLAVAGQDSFSKFTIAGGYDGTNRSNLVSLLTVNAACSSGTLTETPSMTTGGTRATLQSSRSELVAFPKDQTDEFIVAAGTTSGSNAVGHVDVITVTWGASPPTVDVVNGTALTNARRAPTAALYGTDYAILGGRDNAGTAINKVQWYTPGNTSFTAEDSDDFLSAARYGFPAQYLPSLGKIVTYGGIDSFGSVVRTVDKIQDNP